MIIQGKKGQTFFFHFSNSTKYRNINLSVKEGLPGNHPYTLFLPKQKRYKKGKVPMIENGTI